MDRRKFLINASTVVAGGAVTFSFSRTGLDAFNNLMVNDSNLATTNVRLYDEFMIVVQWLNDNGWDAFIKEITGEVLEKDKNRLVDQLTRKLPEVTLMRFRSTKGLEDFAGVHLIRPGFPAFSLLYHILASPRVRSKHIRTYPELYHLDQVENFIYALADWNTLKEEYGVSKGESLVLAVFAYEYRPAYKTPHHTYADLVFSRTGVGRIGEETFNFDPINRSFINKPKDINKSKNVAVLPARYGLFIARKVRSTEVSLLMTGHFKVGDQFNDQLDSNRYFLQPIRKVFNNDELFNYSQVKYLENHKSEKLVNLCKNKKLYLLKDLVPTIRRSEDLIAQEGNENIGSTFLVISKPFRLIRQAEEKGYPLYFIVPTHEKSERYFNAYYTNEQQVENVELLFGNVRESNKYDLPRNQALFVNITHELPDTSKVFVYKPVLKDLSNSFDLQIRSGEYFSPLFEDNICDGNVSVDTSALDLSNLPEISKNNVFPAYSIITAPDFFPQVDGFDLLEFDVAPGNNTNSNFFEGGVASLATARLIPNPKMISGFGDPALNTYTSVLSGPQKNAEQYSVANKALYNSPTFEKDYIVSGFLPDASSSVFAPGWDITYAGGAGGVYLSTEGLGSPFIEDMRLCSAMNGMWPAAAPDASRTYQGSFEPDYRNPTAIPLLDDELGFHKSMPGMNDKESSGWDGEQGPFIEKINGKWKVNFTDLGRADCVRNALDGKLDFSRLRELTSAELILRMDCLRTCIKKLPKVNFGSNGNQSQMVGYTYHWLVSAEKANWGAYDVKAYGIPSDLVGSNKEWITKKENALVKGSGYLYMFIDTLKDTNKIDWVDAKRRRLGCKVIYICQVTASDLVWGVIKGNSIIWHR